MNRFTVISGCSGGGKSTLLAELQRRGYSVIEEPGRRIVKEELAVNGVALPWFDLPAFARRAIHMALEDRRQAQALAGRVFFDRGLIDAVVALVAATGDETAFELCKQNLYGSPVFLTPPWPEIYVQDSERQHDLAAAIAEYERLLSVYKQLGYEVIILPKLPLAQRADFIQRSLFS